MTAGNGTAAAPARRESAYKTVARGLVALVALAVAWAVLLALVAAAAALAHGLAEVIAFGWNLYPEQ